MMGKYRRKTRPPPAVEPLVSSETLFFVSAAVAVLAQGGALGVRAMHFYVLADTPDEARHAFLTTMQGAPFSYQITDIIITGIPRDVLEALAAGRATNEHEAQVWH